MQCNIFYSVTLKYNAECFLTDLRARAEAA